jgi:hypothetical protein
MTAPIGARTIIDGSGQPIGVDYIYDSDAPGQGPTVPADNGFTGWSVPLIYPSAASITSGEGVAAGTMRGTRIRRFAGGTISNLYICVTTAGATLSNCFAALYGSDGALFGQTADQSTAWQSTGVKQMALASPAADVPSGDIFVCFWFNGTTAPTLMRIGYALSATQMNYGLSAANSNFFHANTGLTTTAPATIGTKTASGLGFWVAVS